MRFAIRLIPAVSMLAMAPYIDAQSLPKHSGWVTETKTLKPDVRYEFQKGIKAGKLSLKSKGKAGKCVTTFEVRWVKGKQVKKALFCDTMPAIDEVYVIGAGGYASRSGSFSGRKIMAMNSTGYDPYPPGGSGTGKTATGIAARFGIAAVDPRVIPLGTLLYVEGYGMALAADTGGAIKGAKIDLCFNTRAQAYQWGRRSVKVHVLRER